MAKKEDKLPTMNACIKAGTHMLRCTGDGYCKVCFDRRDYEPDLLSFNVETGKITPHPERLK